MSSIEEIIKIIPKDALTPQVELALGRTSVQAVPTIGGRKTFKRKGGRKHRRKTHKKNKRRSSKRRQ